MSDLHPVERATQIVLEILCVCSAAVALFALFFAFDVWAAFVFGLVAVACWEAAALLDD